ncbi:MAG: ABC transporter ATP-binding protein [Thermodesulfobacteriota bacterium]
MLNITDLSVFYGRVKALDQVSLAVREGELVTVIGPNGAGKTTLVKAIMGLAPIAAGRIESKGVDLTGLKPWDRIFHRISYVPEGARIFPRLSVEDNLKVGAFRRRDDQVEQDMGEVYRLFPILEERRRQMGGTLSGGQQQMLAIGRTLVARAGLLIIDEMSLGLMPILVQSLFNLIKNLRHKNISVLLIEQNARKALEIADRGYLLENGRIVLEGSSARLAAEEKVKRVYLGG